MDNSWISCKNNYQKELIIPIEASLVPFYSLRMGQEGQVSSCLSLLASLAVDLNSLGRNPSWLFKGIMCNLFKYIRTKVFFYSVETK